ncbi:hypothetical protein ACIGN6_32120 [Streptomyces sp. NPDC053792]|uniref:hypothetical protein n=1 Tax=Streptomyces sp. NPDC053792 TaxID=3365716 RepID=UPI0037CDC6CA
MHATHRTKPTTLTHPRAAARILRTIAQAGPLLRTAARGHLCARCDVAWTGQEADCWNCGSPATVSSHRQDSTLHRLLAATTPRAFAPTGAAS